ncbi:MAG: FAD-dependent oxidoreductase [Bacteroidota bacterium]
MKKVLIVGQGIAGTVLACTLQRHGVEVQIMDAGFPHSSSAAAAGVINPITGKRYARSWLFDRLFPAAQVFYKQLEAEHGIQIWHDHVVERLLKTPEEINNWSLRCGMPEFSDWMSDVEDNGVWSPYIRPGFKIGRTRQAARVNFPLLMQTLREKWVTEGNYQSQVFDFQLIAQYRAQYNLIVFCDGFRAQQNPFFGHLQWQLSKGELLLIRFPAQAAPLPDQILKGKILVAPVGDGLYWAGSNNVWNIEDEMPTEQGGVFLREALYTMFETLVEIVAHRAAVRPTVKDRRPYVGLHPDFKDIGIFNGMGSKGALLSPYWAEHFAQHLLEGTELDEEVDVRRIVR